MNATREVVARHLMALMLGFFSSGCATDQPRLVSAGRIPLYGSDPLSHTVYVGSDERYHYFAWSSGLRSGQVKVDRSALALSHEFGRGEGKAFLTRKEHGKVDVLLLEKQ